MALVPLLVFIVVCGIAWHFLAPYIGSPFREICVVIFVLVFCLWLLNIFGILSVPAVRLQ